MNDTSIVTLAVSGATAFFAAILGVVAKRTTSKTDAAQVVVTSALGIVNELQEELREVKTSEAECKFKLSTLQRRSDRAERMNQYNLRRHDALVSYLGSMGLQPPEDSEVAPPMDDWGLDK